MKRRRISSNMIKQMDRFLREGFSQAAICELFEIDDYIVKDIDAGFIRRDLTNREQRKWARVQTPQSAQYVISDEPPD